MGLEGICALYSFKINAPRPDMLRGGMGPLQLDPYDRLAEDRRRAQEQADLRAEQNEKRREQERQRLNVYPLSDGTQLHSHDGGYGLFKNNNVPIGRRLTAYESAMAEHFADVLGLPAKKRLCNPRDDE